MVGTTRFELATSPTPISKSTQHQQLSYIHQCVRERETTRRNAYWTLIGPTVGPRFHYLDSHRERGTNGKQHR